VASGLDEVWNQKDCDALWGVAGSTTRRGLKMKRPAFAAMLAISLSAFVAFVPTRSFADDRCQQLEALHAQYAGVQLTSYQKQVKVVLVAWYVAHCNKHQVAGMN
jgi:hypothetical protein